jgi:hypothetical protein
MIRVSFAIFLATLAWTGDHPSACVRHEAEAVRASSPASPNAHPRPSVGCRRADRRASEEPGSPPELVAWEAEEVEETWLYAVVGESPAFAGLIAWGLPRSCEVPCFCCTPDPPHLGSIPLRC